MNSTSFYCGRYLITSYGNGTAYEVTQGNRSVHLQGDDCIQLREQTEDFSNPSALDDFFFEFFSN